MNKTFNTVRYIELLKKDQNLKSKNYSLYQENIVEFEELVSYKVILDAQIKYNRRHNYFSLIEEYLNKEIDTFELRDRVFKLQNENMKIEKDLENDREQLFNVLIDSKSAEFSSHIEDLFGFCELFIEEDHEMTDSECRAILEEISLQIKKYSNK